MPTNLETVRQDYYDRLAPLSLAPLWEVLADLVTPSPRPRTVPALWHFAEIRPLLMEAGDLITAHEAERRVLILENPAMPGESRITGTLYAGVQLVLPGEVAPAHRHSQSALRFILDGEGAFTAVNGERTYMQRYDLILTPNWLWHDHGNEGANPMIWLDGLDIPLVQSFDASFAEKYAGAAAHPATRPAGDAPLRWGQNMRPARAASDEQGVNPMFCYRYAEWRGVLAAMAAADPPHPHEGHVAEFTNPVDGGPVMATISAFAQLVPAGFATRAMRSSDGMILVVVEGGGTLLLDDREMPLAAGDILTIPAWARRRFLADQELVMFGYSDRAAQQALRLWREELL